MNQRAKRQQKKDNEDALVALLVAFDGIEDGVRNVDAIVLPSMEQGCQKLSSLGFLGNQESVLLAYLILFF